MDKCIFIFFFNKIMARTQVPNGGFEELDDFNNPSNWYTTNVPGFVENITKSEDAHSGDFAVRGEVLEFMAGLK